MKTYLEDTKPFSQESITNDILSTLNAYEIDVDNLDRGLGVKFKCNWKSVGLDFQLRLLHETNSLSCMEESLNMPTIFILIVTDVMSLDFQVLESFSKENGYLMIFDTNDDIQAFSKDLWNLLTFLNSQHPSI